MATLKLTLSKKPFEVMITGEKTEEYRRVSQWIQSRLFDKSGKQRHYEFVEFVNGYGKDKPRFTALYKGFTIVENVKQTYSNGLILDINEPTFEIKLARLN